MMLQKFTFEPCKTFKIAYSSPLLGKIIFSSEKILKVNSTFCNFSKYTKEELKNLKLSDIVASESKEKVKLLEEKLLKNEKITSIEKIKFIKKDKSSFWLISYLDVLYNNNKTLGLLFGADITYEQKFESLFYTLKEINQLILQTTFEKELFERICPILVKNLNLKLAWIGSLDEENKTIKLVYKYGENVEYLEKIKISLDENLPEGQCPTVQAFKKGKIIINPDSRVNPNFLLRKEDAIKKGYLSSCAIPLKKHGKVVAVLNLYSPEPYFFDKAVKPLLEEIQRDLSFGLEKIERIKNNLLIVTALSKAKDWIIITDENGYILNVNDIVCQATGYSKEELIGKHASFLDNFNALLEFYEELNIMILKKKKEYNNIFVKRSKDGKEIFLVQEIIPVKLPGDIAYFVIIGKDVTEELKIMDKLEKFKNSDLLTGLLNLDAFAIKVDEILKILTSQGILILMDIWGMSYINKSHGLEIGNNLIKKIASILQETFKDNAIIGRLGGDEFGIFLYNIHGTGTFEIAKLAKIFENPIKIDDYKIKVKINLGCSFFPLDGKSFKDLYEKATISLKEAKNEGPGVFVFYNKELSEKLEYLLKAEDLVTRALEKDLFIFYYQPYFDISNLELAGFEALVRIKKDDGKIYYPDSFIDYLEEHEEYLFKFEQIGLEKIIKQIERWKKPISFNLSAKSLQNTPFIRKIINIFPNIAKNLIIEITERELIKIINIAIQNLKYLKSKNTNIKLAIDDFGTGHANFSYLKDLPVDYVKIDISFIRRITKGEKEKKLVKGIIDLCHNLGFETVAEGVETEEHYKILKELGCDKVQGFYFSKPLPPEEIEKKYLT
ncbi:EAL domain-containing protein [Thermodesulfobacterium hydrogeniphilum]|uniref:EAL domain-containing protein n=1 Tax=Thermodesulfobacterium hydrogeniphilum TaxID=161156 RepID=UPI000A033737|nr:EAL domain-containing protein [Thermodesulfobacterium hydrogeniphilum]